jgi:hypothetical protein
MLPNREEHGLGALRRQCGQNGRGIARPGTVIEGQYDLTWPQEVVALEVLETKARAASGVDLNHA